jgi:hypothetical protein
MKPSTPARRASANVPLTIQSPISAPQSKSAQVIFRHFRNLVISHHLL